MFKVLVKLIKRFSKNWVALGLDWYYQWVSLGPILAELETAVYRDGSQWLKVTVRWGEHLLYQAAR